MPEPGPGEVRVKTHTIGVGKPDVLVRSGLYPWNQTLPVVPGHEMAGHVDAVGADVTAVAVGQPVLVIRASGGGYAEYAVVRADRLIKLPADMDPERAVGTLDYLAAWAMLHETVRVTSGQTLYLNGASGGVGTAIIQLAKRAGLTVIAGASTDAKCAFAAARGADHTIQYSESDAPDRIAALTDGRGVDVMLDQFVGPDFNRTFEALATFGQVLLYNATGGFPDASVLAAMFARVAHCPAVRVFSLHCYDKQPAVRARLLSQILQALAAGEIGSHISDRLPLDQARLAHERLDAGSVLGKQLLKP